MNKKHRSSYYLILLTYLFFQTTLFAQNSKVDSLSLALKNATHDTTRASTLVALTEELFYSNQDTVIPLCEKAIQIADKNSAVTNAKEKRSFLKSKADALHNIGFCHNTNGDASNGMSYYQKALKIREQIVDKSGIAHSFINIGVIYSEQGDVQKALDYYRKALAIQESIGDKDGAAYSLNNIGFIYNNLKNTKEALNYYNKSIKLRQEIGDKKGVANQYNNIAVIYIEKKELAKAMDYAHKSLKIRQEMGDKKKIAMSYGVIANIYKNLGDIQFAKEYFDKSLALHEETNNKMGMAFCLSAMSDFYVKLGDEDASKKNMYYQKALEYAKRSLLISNELKYPMNIKNAEKSLSTIYSKLGKIPEAFEHYKQFIIYKDSLDNEGNRTAGIKSQMKYEFDKKEAVANAEHKKELESHTALAEERNKKQKIIIWSAIACLLVLALFAGYIFRTLSTTKEQKKIIELKSEETEFQKQIIEEKNKNIIDSIEYAKRIQQSLLPTEKYINKQLKRLQKK